MIPNAKFQTGCLREKEEDDSPDEESDYGAGATYYLMWCRVPAGTYTLTAKATDEKGAVSTSNPVRIKVTRRPANKRDSDD